MGSDGLTTEQIDTGHITQLLRDGHALQAEQACRQLLDRQPEDETALTLLGVALQYQGRALHAAAVHERLTVLYPDHVGHWVNLGTAFREGGLLQQAEEAYLLALRLDPGNAGIHANIGLFYKEAADYGNARQYLEQAARQLPDDAEICIYAAMACCECGDNTAAAALVTAWRQWLPLNDDLTIDLAWMFTQMGRIADAEQLLGDSMTLVGARPRTRARMVGLLERVNRLDEADVILATLPDPASLSDPVDQLEVISAMGVMAMRGRDPAAARALLQRLIALTTESNHLGNLYFSLAKVCDKQGDAAAAMEALAKAHAAQMVKAAQLVPELLLPGVQPLSPALIRMTPAQTMGWAASPHINGEPPAPIFVVGFPRSGTTMLELMLDAHPSLASMDEQPFMQAVSERVLELGIVYPEALGDLDEAACQLLRQHYWDQTATVISLQPGQRLVDKNPLNLLHLPLIHRLFPEASIILALRHPCDVILSCYMQNFRASGFQVLCSSLERLARGYVNGMQYWIYHENLFKPQVLHLRYEDLLDDFDAEVERIGSFIGIDDAASLRDFHLHAQQKGFISTPSYAQVVQPPNKSAVGRWRRYEQEFAPLLPILKDVMEHWGYDC
jgi:tetratricopeptide (TPR) repeat protein